MGREAGFGSELTWGTDRAAGLEGPLETIMEAITTGRGLGHMLRGGADWLHSVRPEQVPPRSPKPFTTHKSTHVWPLPSISYPPMAQCLGHFHLPGEICGTLVSLRFSYNDSHTRLEEP